MLQSNSKLKAHISSLWDILWTGGNSNPITAIEQITYLLFMKQLDELDDKRLKQAKSPKKRYKSKFSGKYLPPKKKKGEEIKAKDLKWNNFKNLPKEDLYIHVKDYAFPFLKTLNDESSPFAKHMSNAIFDIQKPTVLKGAVEKIEEIFIEIDEDAKDGKQAFQDIQGDVYEMLLGEIAQAGKNGQFRTPRHLIKLMAELIKPKLGDKIADPACGTGGFLLGAYQYIVTDLVRKKTPSKLIIDEDGFESGVFSSVLTANQRRKLEQNLCGFDIDTTMVRLGLMNLIMHGIDNPQIEYTDTLSKLYNEAATYDIVLANPPFTGKIDKSDINVNLKINTNSTELLFIARISRMLKENGKAAIIIPEGVLFGSSKAHKATREILLKDNRLDAVISLPSGSFKPYTNVKTSILIFVKENYKNKEWKTDKVWFYALKDDGYTLDDSRRKRKNNPLPVLKDDFTKREKIKSKNRKNYFFVPIKEIKDNGLDLSYNRYKEFEYRKQHYESPKELLDNLRILENEILHDLDELNEMFG